MRLFALALIPSLVIASPLGAWPTSLRPIDQCRGDASFSAFRQRLEQVVSRKDRKALLAFLAPDVLVDFGGGSGRNAFAQRWKFEPGEYGNVWNQLETLLKLGCARDEGTRIIPSLIMQLGSDPSDEASEPILMLPGAKLYKEAGVESSRSQIRAWTVGTVISRASDTMTGVRLPDGREGFVTDDRAYELLGYRMTVERRGAKWMITSFVSGD